MTTKQALLAEFGPVLTDRLSGKDAEKVLRRFAAALDRVERSVWEKAHRSVQEGISENNVDEALGGLSALASITKAALAAGHDLSAPPLTVGYDDQPHTATTAHPDGTVTVERRGLPTLAERE